MSKPFHCIKLKSGETIFAEILNLGSQYVTLYVPMLITTEIHGSNESMSMIPWIPYVESSTIEISTDHIYFSDELNKQFLEYYGRVVIQLEMNKIKQSVSEKMESRFDVIAISEGLREMKQVSDELTKKFGVDGPDFTEFEEILEKHKAEKNIVLH